jgi:hypothetical protein
MRALALFLTSLLTLPFAPGAAAQETPLKLSLVVVEGDGAINNIRQRTAREPVVQVEDQNHKPIAGAVVVFTLPSNGAGGTFANGARTLTVMTDNQGRAVARGLQPNHVQGQFQIHVNASFGGQTVTANIAQTNALAGAAGGAAAGGAGISGKLIAIIAIVGAAAAGGAVYATRSGGGGSNNTQTPSVTVTPGTGTVGPPR